MTMQQKNYLCPKCKGHLNVGENVIFATTNKRKKKGLVLLHHDIGTYDYKKNDNYHFEKGEMVDFCCPLCCADLISKKNNDFACITMIDHQNMEYDLLFSRKEGSKSTYIVSNDNIEMFGEDAENWDDVFEEE